MRIRKIPFLKASLTIRFVLFKSWNWYLDASCFGGYVIEEYIYQIDIEGNVVGIVK